jgi:hypothetical protein
MDNQHALSFLIKLRAEKAGRIEQYKKEIEIMREDLVSIDRVIRMAQGASEDGGIDPGAIPPRQRFPRRSEWFERYEQSRIIYKFLGELPDSEATGTEAIVNHAMRIKGRDPEQDKQLRRDFYNRFACQLRAMSERGAIEKVGRGKGVKWRLPKDDDLGNSSRRTGDQVGSS